MPFVRYVEKEVTNKDLERIRRKIEQAPTEERIGRAMALLHYGNLQRWRYQGYHFHYLSGPNAFHCTCGLVIDKEKGESPAVLMPLFVEERIAGEFEVDEVQKYLGHRNLLDGSGFTAAILTSFHWSEVEDEYRWGGFCQICGEVILDALGWDAKEFVGDHNGRCKVGLKQIGRAHV